MNFEYLSHCINQANNEISAGRFQEGKIWCDRALKEHPTLSEGWYFLGRCYQGLGNLSLAIESFKKASAFAPDSSEAQNANGLALLELGFELEAEACLKKSIALNPSDPAPLSNLGILRKNQHRFQEAASLFINAIKLAPDLAVLYSNLAGILNKLDFFEDAVLASKKAISLSPDLADAWNNLSISLGRLNKNKEAKEAAVKALALNPSINWLQGAIIYSKLKICDWDDINEYLRDATCLVRDMQCHIEPLALLSLTDDTELQQKCALIYSDSLYKQTNRVPPIYNHQKIRIGYISSDFGSHAVSYLTTGLIECHDRNHFEIHGFDTGKHGECNYHQRISRSFDSLHKIADYSKIEMIKYIQNQEIDILIDLNGHTKGAVTEVFAARAAPIQVNFIGYPGSMGAKFMDYIIGDRTLIPIAEAEFYTEKVLFLPYSFQPNDSKRAIGSKKERGDYGLSNDVFVFACFNQAAKITPQIFTAWMLILKAVPDSVLWLAIEENDARLNLVEFAKKMGVSITRIHFADRVDYRQHLARHKLVDLMLDTFPFNGGTTTSDALWCGVPLLTLSGRSFCSRMGSSLLNAIGLSSLITDSIDEYTEMAIRLALGNEELAKIQLILGENIKNCSLFNTEEYTHQFEQGLRMAFNRLHAGMNPDHIHVPC